MKIILGSRSFGRKQILERAEYRFEVIPADIDEKAIRSKDYEELPLLLARAKAHVLLEKIRDPSLLITSDQIVVCNNQLREKPESEDQAREYLKSYAHFPAQTNTAVVVTNTATGAQAEGLDIAKVFFNPIPDKVIDELIFKTKLMHTAGGFIVEDPLFSPYIHHIEGEKDSITGLPLILTQKLISQVK